MSYTIDDDLDVFLQEPFGQEVEYSGGLRTVSYTHLTLPTNREV